MNDSSLYQCMRIKTTTRENYRSRVIELEGKIKAEPGQFLMVWVPELGEKPYSIMRNDPLTILVVAVGSFSRGINRLRAGERIWLRGPLGKGFSINGRHSLLVGGGYGAAPLFNLAQKTATLQGEQEICLGGRIKADLVLLDEFSNMGFPVFSATEDGSFGHKGLVTSLVEKRIKAFAPDGIYACGPEPMLAAVERMAAAHHISCQLSREAQMRCGIGLCGSCELETGGEKTGWLTCVDGPVLKK